MQKGFIEVSLVYLFYNTTTSSVCTGLLLFSPTYTRDIHTYNETTITSIDSEPPSVFHPVRFHFGMSANMQTGYSSPGRPCCFLIMRSLNLST